MSCQNCDHHDSSGFTSGFLLGLIVGGAGGYLLTTEKGQALLAELKAASGDKLKEIADNPLIADKLADLEKTMAEARAALKSGSASAREKVHQAAQQVAEVTSSQEAKSKKNFFFKRGRALS